MFVDGSRPVYRVDAVTDGWLDQVRSSHGQHVSINLTSSDWRTSLASVIQLSDDAANAGDGGGLRLCSGRWRPPQHAVFHVAHALLLVSFLIPITRTSLGFIHLAVVAGYAVLSVWSWRHVCSPDSLSWNVSFIVINLVQLLVIMFRLRPICLSPQLQQLYTDVFRPLNMSRQTFKKLVSGNICSVETFSAGSMYAHQDVTRTNRLALLITGLAQVTCDGVILHVIHPGQFLDSSQYESAPQLNSTFKVSIRSLTDSCCVIWNRQLLDCLLAKDAFINAIVSNLIGRDVTNKAYQTMRRCGGHFVDVRLHQQLSTPCNDGLTQRGTDDDVIERSVDIVRHNEFTMEGAVDRQPSVLTNGIGLAA